MRPFLALLRKQVHESRWTLVLSAAALFGLGWLLVYFTSLGEARIMKEIESDSDNFRIQMLRNLGLAERPSSISLMIASWNHPLVVLLVSMWAIGRGSAAVAAEVERGTLDLILSRRSRAGCIWRRRSSWRFWDWRSSAQASSWARPSRSITTPFASRPIPGNWSVRRSISLAWDCPFTDILCWLRRSTTSDGARHRSARS